MTQHYTPVRRSKNPRVDVHMRIGAPDWQKIVAYHQRRIATDEDPGYSVQDTLRRIVHLGLQFLAEHGELP